MSARFPMPPGVIGKIVRAAADPDTSVADMASLVAKDAMLSAQVLRTVNSASFGLRHRVAAVDRAVSLMGIRSVRNLVLSLGVRDLVPAKNVGDFPLGAFWEGSLRRGAAARCLGQKLELPDVDELFTMGLCQDLGLIMRVSEDESLAARLAAVFAEPSDSRLDVERESGDGHDRLGYAMFEEWRFPEDLALPVLYHHDPGAAPEEHCIRARVAHAAEALADLPLVADRAKTLETASERIAILGLGESDVGPIVDLVGPMVKEFAELVGLTVADQPSFEEIFHTASAGLVELSLSFERDNRDLQSELTQRERVADELRLRNYQLDQQARTDELTGLANRRSFDESLLRELSVAQRRGTVLSLLMMDIDHFKQLNDAHGHPAGDLVLKEIGRLLPVQLRRSDTAARYGGEEFAAILPYTSHEQTVLVAERIRTAIERMGIVWQGQPLEVTMSLGGSTFETVGSADADAASLIVRMADEALYRAKQRGRNRVCSHEPVRQPV